MSSQSGFWSKLISKVDKLDQENLQLQFLNLARERGLLETIFQSIQEGVLVVTSNGKLLYANRAVEQMFGFESSRISGRQITKYIPDVDWEKLASCEEEEWMKLTRSEIEVFHPEHRIISLYAVPLEAGFTNESDKCVLSILRDITRDREQEESIVESEKMKAIRFLASSLAHEIGNPLNSLGIHLQLFERELKHLSDDDRERLSEYITVARDEVSRLDLIISRFLSALRPSPVNLEPCDIQEILEESLRIMKADIESHRIQVSIEHLKKLPIVKVDIQQMKQVFFNIIKNAIQAMSDNGTLKIALDADDRDLSISFKDSGVGIDEKNMNLLFEPYRTSKKGGNGLGLAIVDRIINDHGGRLEVTSKRGVGTCFRIVLPLADRKTRLLSKSN